MTTTRARQDQLSIEGISHYRKRSLQMKQIILSLTICLMVFGSFTGTADAIPSMGDYELSSRFVNGPFTSDGTKLTAWHFNDTFIGEVWTTRPQPFTRLFRDIVNNTQTFALTPDPPFAFFSLNWDRERTFQFYDANILGTSAEPFTVTNVPEPTAAILFATGLFGLACYRWHQRRRAGRERTVI